MEDETTQEQEIQEEQEAPEVEEPTEETGEEEEGTPLTDEDTPKTVPVKALQEERRKRQETEAKLKEIEERQAAQQTAQPAQKSVYDYYDEDPDGVMRYIDTEIQRLATEDPWSNAVAIEELRNNKLDLKLYGMNRQQEVASKFKTTLQQTIPQFEAVTKYAITELGYSPDETKWLAEPSRNKAEADMKLKILKTINRAYEKENAGKTLQAKEVKRTPTSVETPGSGVPQTPQKLQKLYDEAKRTGNWTQYLEAAGI